MDQEHPGLGFDLCENPTQLCKNAATVPILHQVLDPDTEEVTETNCLGHLCQACAMRVVLNQMHGGPADHTLN